MGDLLVFGIIFFIPATLIIIFSVSLEILIKRKVKNKSLPPDKRYPLSGLLAVTIVTGVLGFVFAAAIIGLAVILTQAVAHM